MSKKSKRLGMVGVAVTVASSTRDAVESSIELSKGDSSTTWEEAAARSLTKITKWEDTQKRQTRPTQDSP